LSLRVYDRDPQIMPGTTVITRDTAAADPRNLRCYFFLSCDFILADLGLSLKLQIEIN
jgi:hypothetical protein